MSFLELAKRRYSTRKYLNTPVEREKLELILEAGRIAPSAHNYQAFKVIIVQDTEGLDKISKTAKLWGAPLAIIVCEDKSRAWINSYNNRQLISHDAVIATTHMMLEAADLGLGSLWIGRFDPAVIREDFSLPGELEAINILAIGYGDGEKASPDRYADTRRPISEMVIGDY